MDKRLFVAIDLPPAHVDALSMSAKQWAANQTDARATAPQNLHLTVCFLGDVAEFDLPGLKEALNQVAAGTTPFKLVFSRIHLAPENGRRPPSMVWAAYQGGAEFGRLAKNVRNAAWTYAPEMPPAKAMRPHVTLIRFRRPEPRPAPPPVTLANPAFEATEMMLYESDLRSGGPVYSVIERFPLGQDNS